MSESFWVASSLWIASKHRPFELVYVAERAAGEWAGGEANLKCYWAKLHSSAWQLGEHGIIDVNINVK